MFIGAPHCVREVILISYNPDSLIRIIRKAVLSIECISFHKIFAPELNIHMFALFVARLHIGCHWDRFAVKVLTEGYASEMKQCRDDIRVARWNSLHRAFCYARSANEERYVDVFFDTTAFAGRQPVLPNVEPIVCCVDQVGVFEDFGTGF